MSVRTTSTGSPWESFSIIILYLNTISIRIGIEKTIIWDEKAFIHHNE